MERGKRTYKELTLLLSYLLGLNAFLSLWGVADSFYTGFFFLLFLLGAYRDFFKPFKIPRIFLNTVALLGTLFFLLSISFDNLIEPIANALLFLISVKFLEEKKLRDFYQILLLSVLSVALSTLLKLDLSFLLFLSFELLLGIFFLFILLVYKNFEQEKLDYLLIKKLFLFSVLFGVGVFLSSWLFFFTLPRVDNPLINVFQSRDRGLISGISDEITLGEIGEIQLDRSVIFRVFGLEFSEPPYWRVQVFDTFVNNKWIKTVRLPEEELSGGRAYTLLIEPTYDTFLPLLNYPTKVIKVEGKRDAPQRFKGGYYEFREPITKPIRVSALFTNEPPRDEPTSVYLQVPEDLPESIKNLAKKLMEGAKDDRDKVRKVEEFFRSGGFKYSLKLGAYKGDPLEDFLFRTKKGNCEYFASSTAILLRLMGVPARLVSGFHGAVKNKYGDYYFVVGGMAHVWVEAYVEGRWITVDTTPPYVPEALQSISTLAYIYDALRTFWYRNVVDFSVEKQRKLLTKTKSLLKEITTYLRENLVKVIYGFIILTVFAFLVYFYLYEVRKTPENLFRKLKRRLKSQGITAELPEEILKEASGHPKQKYIEFIVRAYQRWKYSPIKDKEELKEAYKVLKKI